MQKAASESEAQTRGSSERAFEHGRRTLLRQDDIDEKSIEQ